MPILDPGKTIQEVTESLHVGESITVDGLTITRHPPPPPPKLPRPENVKELPADWVSLDQCGCVVDPADCVLTTTALAADDLGYEISTSVTPLPDDPDEVALMSVELFTEEMVNRALKMVWSRAEKFGYCPSCKTVFSQEEMTPITTDRFMCIRDKERWETFDAAAACCR